MNQPQTLEENRAEQKIVRRDKKKKPKMNISGSSVKTLARLKTRS